MRWVWGEAANRGREVPGRRGSCGRGRGCGVTVECVAAVAGFVWRSEGGAAQREW
jgi:hypothetical protein